MAADEVQRLELKDLDAVLERAKAERWTELALLGEDFTSIDASELQDSGWPAR